MSDSTLTFEAALLALLAALAFLNAAAAQEDLGCSPAGRYIRESTFLGFPADGDGRTFYPANSRCTWILDIPPDKVVTLTFSYVDIGAGDVVHVFSGSRALLSLSGNLEPEDVNVLESHSRITFASGSSTSGYGFDVHVLYVPKHRIRAPPQIDVACSSPRSISWSQTLRFPANNAFYTQNLFCTWIFDLGATSSVSIRIEHLDTLLSADVLTIYDGARPLTSASGNVEPAETFTVTSSGSRLTFNSGSRDTKSRGFRVSITFHATTILPPDILPSACLGSPRNIEHNTQVRVPAYGANTRCLWWIFVPSYEVVTLTVDSFATAEGRDFLDVFDSEKRALHLSGTLLRPVSHVFRRRNAWSLLKFAAGADGAGSGFRFSVFFGRGGGASIPACSLGERVHSSRTIRFPTAGFYPPNAVCTWYLDSSPSQEAVVSFIFLDTEIGADFVSIYDGNKMILTASGIQRPTQPVVVRKVGSKIVFTSSVADNRSGFEVAVQFRGLPGTIDTTIPPMLTTAGFGVAPSQCGSVDVGRVSGSSTVNRWPWTAAVYKRDGRSWRYLCEGVVVARDFVLTTQHCMVTTSDASRYSLEVGEFKFNERGAANARQVALAEIVSPKSYGYDVADDGKIYRQSDVALLRLQRPLVFSATVAPVCFNVETFTMAEGTHVTYVGWGRGRDGFVTVPPFSWRVAARSSCDHTTTYLEFCTTDRSFTVCKGDAGVPGLVPKDGRYHLVALMSRGRNFGCSTDPTTHTDVTKVAPWITFAMRRSSSFMTTFRIPFTPAVTVRPLVCGQQGHLLSPLQSSSEVNQWPWVVAILVKRGDKSLHCAGALVDYQHVVTTKECSNLISDTRLVSVVAGEFDHATHKLGIASGVDSVVTPETPGYGTDSAGVDYARSDIGLVRLAEPVIFGRSLMPICYEQLQLAKNRPVSLAGWTNSQPTAPTRRAVLLAVRTPLRRGPMDCPLETQIREFCTTHDPGVCRATTGNPAMIHQNGRFYLVGLISRGAGTICGGTAIHSDVTALVPWIRTAIRRGK